MTFSPEQIAELQKPLNKRNVKPPAPGKYGEYIEGWKVIDEANRIFGFDAWSRETDEIKCVSERETKMGKNKDRDGWAVAYIARCRIRVGNITREGCGAGTGIDADLGCAHESAIKEAETDAMKRALMTFGNPFGLALYDKSKANVADVQSLPERITDPQRNELIAHAQARGVGLTAILKYYEINDLAELLAVDFEGCKQAILNTPAKPKERVNA
jgi:DNA repair and recombination protein RAD52